jgi:hypothetical protein
MHEPADMFYWISQKWSEQFIHDSLTLVFRLTASLSDLLPISHHPVAKGILDPNEKKSILMIIIN